MRSGASVCPRKILAAAFVLSAAVVPTVLLNNQPVSEFNEFKPCLKSPQKTVSIERRLKS